MTAVLLESKEPGSSSWVIVRGQRAVRVSGLSEGDEMYLSLFNGSVIRERVLSDCTLDLPKEVRRVRAEHIKTSGNPVSVDLIRR